MTWTRRRRRLPRDTHPRCIRRADSLARLFSLRRHLAPPHRRPLAPCTQHSVRLSRASHRCSTLWPLTSGRPAQFAVSRASSRIAASRVTGGAWAVSYKQQTLTRYALLQPSLPSELLLPTAVPSSPSPAASAPTGTVDIKPPPRDADEAHAQASPRLASTSGFRLRLEPPGTCVSREREVHGLFARIPTRLLNETFT